MSKPKDQSCNTCLSFVRKTDFDGTCHFLPPLRVEEGKAAFPYTNSDSWCRKYELDPVPPPPTALKKETETKNYAPAPNTDPPEQQEAPKPATPKVDAPKPVPVPLPTPVDRPVKNFAAVPAKP